MSRKRITLADGRSVVVNFDGEPTQQDLTEAAEHIGQHRTLGQLPILSTINRFGKALYGGGAEAVRQAPQQIRDVLSHLSPEAPARDARALAAALQHPIETGTRVAQAYTPETVKFILGALGGDPTAVTPPSLETVGRETGQLGAQELLAAIPGLAKRGVRAVTRRIPGAPVALHEMAIPEVEAVAKTGRPSEQAVNQAFATAAQAQAPPVWMGHFRKTARSLLEHEKRLAPANRDAGLIHAMESFLQDSAQGWSPEKWKMELDRMGAVLGGIGGTEGLSRVHGTQIGQLTAAMYRDIESARVATQRKAAVPPSRSYKQVGGSGMFQWVDEPGKPAVFGPTRAIPETFERAQKWTEAQRLARRRHAFNDLESMVNARGVISVTGDQYKSLNINAVLRNIDQQIRLSRQTRGPGVKRAKRFVGSFQPGELQAIRARFDEIAGDLPRIPLGRGTPHGSGGYLLRAVAGEAGGALVGHPALGVAAGIAIPEIISRAVRTAPGRAAIRFAARLDPKIGVKFQQALVGLLRSQSQPQEPQAVPQPVPSPSPAPIRTPAPGDELLHAIIRGGLMPQPEVQ